MRAGGAGWHGPGGFGLRGAVGRGAAGKSARRAVIQGFLAMHGKIAFTPRMRIAPAKLRIVAIIPREAGACGYGIPS